MPTTSGGRSRPSGSRGTVPSIPGRRPTRAGPRRPGPRTSPPPPQPTPRSAPSRPRSATAALPSLFAPRYHFTVGSEGLPGVTRSFVSFDAAAAEAGQSRIYGGIHFPFDSEAGLSSGHALGQFVVGYLLLPVADEDE